MVPCIWSVDAVGGERVGAARRHRVPAGAAAIARPVRARRARRRPARATRPILITGLECGPDDAKWLRAFAETLPAPVLATPKGRGVLAEPHPLALGLLAASHPLLARADLILLVGVDPSELPPGLLSTTTPVARIGRAAWAGGTLVADVPATSRWSSRRWRRACARGPRPTGTSPSWIGSSAR